MKSFAPSDAERRRATPSGAERRATPSGARPRAASEAKRRATPSVERRASSDAERRQDKRIWYTAVKSYIYIYLYTRHHTSQDFGEFLSPFNSAALRVGLMGRP